MNVFILVSCFTNNDIRTQEEMGSDTKTQACFPPACTRTAWRTFLEECLESGKELTVKRWKGDRTWAHSSQTLVTSTPKLDLTRSLVRQLSYGPSQTLFESHGSLPPSFSNTGNPCPRDGHRNRYRPSLSLQPHRSEAPSRRRQGNLWCVNSLSRRNSRKNTLRNC
jgi:hypothetical protein